MSYTRKTPFACSGAALKQSKVAGGPLKPANGHHGQHAVICCLNLSGTDGPEGGIMLQASEIKYRFTHLWDIMLHASETKKRFTHLQQTVSDASRACHADATVPKDLMNWVDELDKECKSAKKVMSSRDQDRIRLWVDDLERIGDRVEQASQKAGGLDDKIRDAVSSMHSELSDLKRQLQ